MSEKAAALIRKLVEKLGGASRSKEHDENKKSAKRKSRKKGKKQKRARRR